MVRMGGRIRQAATVLWLGTNVATMATVGQRVPSPRDVVRGAQAAWKGLKLAWRALRQTRPRHVVWVALWTTHVLAFFTMFTGSLPMPVRMGGMVLAFASGSAVGFVWSSQPPRRRMVRVGLLAFALNVGPAALVVSSWFS